MDRFQPLRNTIGSLAGSPIPRNPRPGEQFDIPETYPTSKRIRTFAALLGTGMRRLRSYRRSPERPAVFSEASSELYVGDFEV